MDKFLSKTNGSLESGDGGGSSGNKRLSVERIYQKKTQLEHILLRPDTYIGSTEPVTQLMWVWDAADECMVQREITFVPGLYKIFDEILVNAADNKMRDPKGMNTIKIDIDSESNKIKIWNNGKGIPVVEHQKEKMYVPTLIFGHLLTSSNYDDTEKKVVGGRNGYGAKLCNIFSSKFIVETSSHEYKKAFKQSWSANMMKAGEVKIIPSKGDDYTCITFHPDLAKFKMEKLDADTIALFTRRAYDMCGSSKGVKVFLNGKRLPIKGFKDYVDLYIKNKMDDTNTPLKLVHEVVNDRWEVGITLSDKGFQQVSFVNSIATTKGGRHVDYVADQVVSKLVEVVKKKEKNAGINIKPFQVKNHLWVFVNCLIENPSFDSQTKENMTLQMKQFGSKCSFTDKFITQVKSHMWIFVNCLIENPSFDSQTKENMTTVVKQFGSKCPLSDAFVNKVNKCGIVESIQSWMRFKQQAQLSKKMSATKTNKLKGVPKLDDANDAGTKHSLECSLILTEGDSAKTLAVAGLGVVGRDRFGVFPLRGKVLNVREASHKQIMENAEINNVIKIMGLRYNEKYPTPESLKTLRYGKIIIMTDQDQDGSHIKGLLVNFIHHNWPNLLKHKFLEEFITPIIKVTKRNDEKSFYSLPEFEEWKSQTDNWHTWKVKYYKGLGTSTSKEAKEYFSDMRRHLIPFKYSGPDDDASIELAFSRKRIDDRKEWLTNWMEERKRRSELGLPELFLYGKNTRSITYNEFVNRELILFSNADNERSIPSLVDGLKPGQRKVMFTCFKRNLVKEIKVAQFAGSVAELSSYHHGEQSLMSTIITLAQNYVGSNNINLLQPNGQFGTRLHGGKDAASPRYIFTQLSPLTRLMFHVNDDPLLKFLYDDNLRIEPEWYVPILPTVLVNGSEGIGTGWSTKIPNYDAREICANIERMLDGLDPLPMLPSYKNFRGTIEQLEDQKYVVHGEVAILDNQTIEITELPIRTWTQAYKESVLEPMLLGTDKVPPQITDYKEYHTDATVRFVVKMTPEKLAAAEEKGLHKLFKLQTTIATSSMVLFDSNGCIKRYENVQDILKEFFDLRKEFYGKRKDYLEGMLGAESLKLDNIARFICEKIDGVIVIENKPKKEIIQMLVRRGFESDPVKAWKESQKDLAVDEVATTEDEESQNARTDTSGPDFNYLLNMPLWNLTKEKKDELVKTRDAKAEELFQLRKKSPVDLWRDDLKVFLDELEKFEKKEKEEEALGLHKASKPKGVAATFGRAKKALKIETIPSPRGQRVMPRIDPSMISKAEAAATRKKKAQVKKETAALNFDDDAGDDSDEPKSLAERLGTKSPMAEGKTKKEAKVTKPRVKKDKTPTSANSRKKGKSPRKKNPWSDSEEEEGFSDASDLSDKMDMSFDEIVPARSRGPRRVAAAKKAKYLDSDDEDEEKFSSDNDDNMKTNKGAGISDDSDFEAPAVENMSHEQRDNEVFGKTSEAATVLSSDEDDDIPITKAAPKMAPAAKKPAAAATVLSSDEDDDIPITKAAPKKAPAAKAKKALGAKQQTLMTAFSKVSDITKKKEAKAVVLDSESDCEITSNGAPAKAAAPAKKKPAPKRKKAAFDSESEDEKPKKGRVSKKPAFVDSEDSDEDFCSAPKRSAPAKKKVVESDEDFGLDDSVVLPSRGARAGRARVTKKYNFGDSDDDSDY